MKSKQFLLALTLIILVLAGCSKKEDLLSDSDMKLNRDSVPVILKSATLSGKYIVVLKKDSRDESAFFSVRNERVHNKANGLLKKYEIVAQPEEVYETALRGFTVKLSEGQLAKLQKDSLVSYVEADQIITIAGKRTTKPAPSTGTTTNTTTTTTSTQNKPWGITRVGGGATYTGTGCAWVIDSGIDLTHPDLNVDKVRGISYVTGITSPNDDNGHGTHVAGTIAAVNNTVGVVGVAAGALVVPVKVLDATGSGTYSSVLAGINYVAFNGKAGDVCNMSLGGGISQSIDDAVVAASANVKFAIAAGNETDNVLNHSPARASGPNIYTVSAMYSGDTWASFSNYGTSVDYCAPGVSIYSTYKGGSYATLSGTSMAAPHVAGLLLLGNINTSGNVIGDPDGTAGDPIAHF